VSLPERLENQAHKAFLEARRQQRELWPEPETTALYKVIYAAALRILATRASRMLYNYVREVAAGRITAEVLLNVDKFNARSRFSTWLYRVARNELYNIVRQIKGRVEVQLDTVPDLQATFHEGHLRLPAGVLSADEERLVRLRLEAGYGFQELAHIFNISLGGVYNLWRKTLAKLKSRLTN
jgi:RNA polymerase sigma factor (sigma-70 family)